MSMDWITTSGRSLDEAKSHALDQLGIVADEAEFEVVNDVEKSLFGRVKTEARVRARVKPKVPAQKDDRRRRSGGKSGGGGSKSGGGNRNRNRNRNGSGKQNAGGQQKKNGGSGDGGSPKSSEDSGKTAAASGGNAGGRRRKGGNGGNGGSAPKTGDTANRGSNNSTKKKEPVVDTVFPREDQEASAVRFLEGVLGAFELSGAVSVRSELAEDEAIELDVTGEELGLLIGPKGNTLNALQELTRTVVQRDADGAKTDRLRVDVSGYRERRAAALANFARSIADDVVDSGTEKVLEPMGAADRKIVHDALTDYEGVETGSEGEDPRRRVVIRPS